MGGGNEVGRSDGVNDAFRKNYDEPGARAGTRQ